MGLTALGKANEKNTGKMGKILEKLMKKYWKNAKNTGKVYGKMQKKPGKVREIRQSKKVGTMILDPPLLMPDISWAPLHSLPFGRQLN